MEARPERPRPLPGSPVPSDHLLPSGANKVERIAQHSKALVDDLTAWVDLKVKLTKLEVEHTIQEKTSEVVVKVIPLVVFALAGFFLLVTVALGLGWLLGHPFWGFLIVTLGLALVGFLLRRNAPAIRRRMMHEPRAAVAADRLRPTGGAPSGT